LKKSNQNQNNIRREEEKMRFFWKILVIMSVTLFMAAGIVAAAGVDELPKDMQPTYQGLDPEQPVGPSAYRDFKAKKAPPWTIGYASSYAGNTWRAAAMDRLMNVLVPKYKKAGLVDKVIITQSDLKDNVQIQQMRQLVDQGVDAIIICCSNVTALNQTVKYAHDKGVPVFSWSGYVTSPFAINTSANYTDGGYQIAKWMAKEIGGKGNVLLVSGIPGAASSESYDNGVKKALAEYSEIKLIGQVAGMWTDQVAQTEVQKFLATHPQKIDGIIAQSASETGAVRAMLQSGRPMIPITLGGEAGAACYWRKHKDWVSAGFHIWPPGDEMEMVFDVLIRTLEGQGPKIQSILRPAWKFTYEEVEAALPETCDMSSADWLQPGAAVWFPSSMADGFFLRPQDPLKWKAK
jgi:ribose transport system substrate-binding protein